VLWATCFPLSFENSTDTFTKNQSVTIESYPTARVSPQAVTGKSMDG